MNLTWTSSNEELRFARIRISQLERSLKKQKEKREETEKEKEGWRKKYEKLEKEHNNLLEKLEKTERARDRYRSLLYKKTQKNTSKEKETQRQEVITTNGEAKKDMLPTHVAGQIM